MTTFALDFIKEFDSRWSEVDILIAIADELPDTDPKFQVTCRAAIVLIVANFEGYLNESIRCLIADVNANSYFSHTSNRMKMTFCSHFFNNEEKKEEKRIKRLADVFDELDMKYTIEPFLFENNKNPKASVIEKLFKGIVNRDFFGYITNCKIEEVFENDAEKTNKIKTYLLKNLIDGVTEFPYKFNLEKLGFNLNHKGKGKDNLWFIFLNETLKARHSVAHGISQDNTMSLTEIKDIKNKIKIMELSFTVLVFNFAINTED